MNTKIIKLRDVLWLETLSDISHDIYHLPEYLYLEAVRNSAQAEAILITDGDKIFFLPYLLRECNDLFDENIDTTKFYDVVSPYGYPGILLSESALNDGEFIKLAFDRLISTFRDLGFYSAFIRLHPILNDGIRQILSNDICKTNGETISINLTLSEAEIWQQTRQTHRNQINKSKRSGMIPAIIPFQSGISQFKSIYYETMNRLKADDNYYFDDEYFFNFSKLENNVHLSIVKLEEQTICAGIFTECCGIIQYHLSGTRNEFFKQSPNVLMLDYVRLWAKERGNQFLHLGGGLGGDNDSLFQFKAGFSKLRSSFDTLRIILDQEKYLHLLSLRASRLNANTEDLLNSKFFPAYRSN